MKILNTLLVILLHLFLTSNAVQATIIDNGTYTTDTGSGLDWLDVTLTIDRSYNDISSQLGIGGEFEGWRYAHSEDVRTLIQNHTGTTRFTKNPYVKTIQFDTAILDNLARSLGITRTGLAPNNGIADWVHGLTSDAPNSTSHAYSFIVTDPQFPRSSVILNWNAQKDNEFSSVIGSHLIRGAVSPVPVPATVWLMATGILGLIGFSRKKQALSE